MDATSSPNNAPLMGLDWGERRIGVAVSPDGSQVFPRNAVTYEAEDALLETLCRLIKEEGFRTVVLGLPVSMSGAESVMSDRVRAFGKKLSDRAQIPVVYEDERLSSSFARNKQQQGSRRDTDSLAAQSVLENYIAKR